mgnify:CR=1 FL=1
MKWNEINYPRIGETVLRTTLPNGLTVRVIPRPGFAKKFAFLATDFGSIDMRFSFAGSVTSIFSEARRVFMNCSFSSASFFSIAASIF